MKVVDVIEAGHWEKTVGNNGKPSKQVCREDGEDWPCAMILAARKDEAWSKRDSTPVSSG